MCFPYLSVAYVTRSSVIQVRYKYKGKIMQPSYAFCFFLKLLFLKNRMGGGILNGLLFIIPNKISAT